MAETLKTNKVNGEQLLHMSNEVLLSMKLENEVVRKVLLNRINKLTTDHSSVHGDINPMAVASNPSVLASQVGALICEV